MRLEIMNSLRRMPMLYEAATFARDMRSMMDGIRKGSFSQHGEDVYIRQFFNERLSGQYLDIGASHPFRISNTYSLYRLGWKGLTVEPIPRLAGLHRKWRPRDTVLEVAVGLSAGQLEFFEMTPSVLSTMDAAVAHAHVANGTAVIHRRYTIDVVPINDVFDRAERSGPIDFVSIDIEGLDARVLSTIDFRRHRPTLICIEANDVVARGQIAGTLENAGYAIAAEKGCNLFCSERASRPHA